ncbi:hypothetical protein V6N13_061256 [Hibiscus sabdariffa]|uniref:Uncharacterized protein n=1 Tax=Hibiscus sabdariffa TaxID=183260 RepID=A0ABR2EFW7_9ROSI
MSTSLLEVTSLASKDDITIYAALPVAPSSNYVNVSRWYNHVHALLWILGVTAGEGCGVVVEGFAPVEAIATSPPEDSKATAVEDDDDDISV